MTPLITNLSINAAYSMNYAHNAVCLLHGIWHHRQWGHCVHTLLYKNFYTTVFYEQYSPRDMHTVFALLCFVVVIHWLIFPYPSGLLHWHCGNLTIAPVPAKQPWWIWINTSCEFIMNDCITTTKQSTTKPCAYFLGYTVWWTSLLLVLWYINRTDNMWNTVANACQFIWLKASALINIFIVWSRF